MTDTAWFVSNPDTGDQKGPIPGRALIEWMKTGAIKPDYYIWRDGMAGWQRADVFSWLLEAPETSAAEIIAPAAED